MPKMTRYVSIRLIKAVVGVCASACMYYHSRATARSMVELKSNSDTVDAATIEKYKDL